MLANADKRTTQFSVAEIFASAYIKTATIDKAINGFRATGVWPFDDAFTDVDYTAAQLTEEEPPTSIRTNMNTQVCPNSTDNSDKPSESQDVADARHEHWQCITL